MLFGTMVIRKRLVKPPGFNFNGIPWFYSCAVISNSFERASLGLMGASPWFLIYPWFLVVLKITTESRFRMSLTPVPVCSWL